MNYFKNEVYSGEIYFIRGGKAKEDGAYPASLMAQDNRPAVVISSQEDIDRSDSVFVSFLSKTRLKPSGITSFSLRGHTSRSAVRIVPPFAPTCSA